MAKPRHPTPTPPSTPGPAPAFPGFLQRHSNGVCLAIKVQPRASRNEIGEALGDELRVKVTAPPVDSAANEALLRFLAETLGCPRSSVLLIRGQTSRHKVLALQGLSAEEVLAKLLPGGSAKKR